MPPKRDSIEEAYNDLVVAYEDLNSNVQTVYVTSLKKDVEDLKLLDQHVARLEPKLKIRSN